MSAYGHSTYGPPTKYGEDTTSIKHVISLSWDINGFEGILFPRKPVVQNIKIDKPSPVVERIESRGESWQ